jgi:hypothetical protein
MALQKDPTPIKEDLKKFAAELVAQGGISQEELNKKVLEEKQRLEKLSQPKKDQLQGPGAAVEVKKASDTASNLESGSSESPVKAKTPEDILKEVKPVVDKRLNKIKKEKTNLSFLAENNIDPYNVYTVRKEKHTLMLGGSEVPNGTVTLETNIDINKAADLTKQVKASISNVILNPSTVSGLIYDSAGYADVYTGWDENQLETIKEHVKEETNLSLGATLSDDSFNNIYDNIFDKALADSQNIATDKQNKSRNNYLLDDKFLLKTTQKYLAGKGAAVRQKVELNTKIDNAYSRYQASTDPLEKENYKKEIEDLQEQMKQVGVTYINGVQNTLPDFAEQGEFFNITGAKKLTEEEAKKLNEKVSLYKKQGQQDAETISKAQGISQREAAKIEYKKAVLDLQIFNKKASEQTLTYDTNEFPYGGKFGYDLNQKGYFPDSEGIITIPIAGLYDMGLTAQDFIGALQVEGVGRDGFSEQEITALKMYDEQKLELSAKADGLFDLAIVNTDPAKLKTLPFVPNLIVSGARAIGQQWFGLNTDQLDDALGKTNRDRKDDLQGAIDVVNKSILEGEADSDFITLNEEQKKAMDVTISEMVSSGVGEFVPMLVELGVLSYVTGGVASVTGITKALQGLKNGSVWSKTLYHGIQAITEEVKMQGVFDFAPTTGAAFYGGGALTQGIGFKKKYKWLDPLFQKVIKSGPVGAVSSEVAELTTFAYDDLMDNSDFSANFNKHFGDIDESGKRLLVNAMVFGLTGVHNVKKTDLMSTQKKLKVRNDLLQKNEDLLSGMVKKKKTEGLGGFRQKTFEDLSKSEQEQYTANLDAASSLHSLFLAETSSFELNVENPAFEKNYQDQVITPMNNALKKIIPGYKGAKVVFGEGERFRNENFKDPTNKAEYDPKSNTMFFDKKTFDLALGNHEIFHLSTNAYFTENPNAAKNFTKKMSNVFAGKKIAGLSPEIIERAIELNYGETNEKGEFSIKKNLAAEEFLAFSVEFLSNPEFYYSNKDLAGTLLGQVKLDLKNFMGEYVNGFNPQTATDLVQIFGSLGESVRTGGKIEEKITSFAELDKINVLGYKIEQTMEKGGLTPDRFASKEIELVETEIDKLEERLSSGEITYETYERELVVLESKLEFAEKTVVTEPVKPTRTSTKRVKLEKIDIDKQYEELTRLREENKAIAEKFGKPPIKGADEKRIENEIIESLKDPIGKLITGRTKALFDPIPEDARAGITREQFQESMRSDLVSMILNEYKPGKQSAEKFLINRGYLRANNLAKRLGVQSVGTGINVKMDAVKEVAVETSSSELNSEVRLIEPVERLIKDPNLKAEFIETVKEATKDLNPEELNYKTLTNAAPELTSKIFGEVFKENGKLDQGQTLKLKQQYIRNNAKALYDILPKGARLMVDGLKSATGIQAGILKNFYKTEDRADMTKGTEAGLRTQTKIPFNQDAFLKVFGALKNQPPSRNFITAIKSLEKEIGKAMTNRVYRQELEAKDVAMSTIQKIADGKSANMASKDLNNALGKAFLKNKVTEEDFQKLVTTVSRNLPKYYGELVPEIINSANKRNVFVENIVTERILGEAGWNLAYDKYEIPYTKFSEVGNDIVGKDGKTERSELVKGLKIIAEEFGDIESLPPFIKRTLLATLGVNRRVLINGKKISQKATGTTNSKDMLNSVLGDLNFKDGSPSLDYKYAYVPVPGKGPSNKGEIGGKGFNGKIESKIVSLREKYKNNTDSAEFKGELIDFVRNELTHPELRGQADGFDLTVQANKKLLEKTYNTLYDAVKSGKLSVQGAGDVLRIQTDHATGIFKLLVPYESVTMGGIGKYRRGDKKNTHNEHMIELQNYNLDFLEILKNSENKAEAKEAITALVDSLGQSIVDVPTQRVKDSKRFGGSAKQVYADRVLNTFLRTNSLNNSLVISGPYKGYTQGEKLYEELGSDGLRKALDRVDSKRRGKQWTEISEALNKLRERRLASKDLGSEFDEIITYKTGKTGKFSDVTAKIEAGNTGKYKLLVSSSADDLVGLMNYNAGKGKKGEADQEFFKKNLYEPYAEAYTLLNRQNVQMAKQFRDIKKHVKSNSPNFNLTKKLPGSKFTYEQALRVAIWDKQGYEIPGLSKVETENLKKVIDSNVDLQVLALNLKRIAGGEYIKPGKDWYAGDIASDLRQGLNTTLREKYLTKWKNNVDAMFTTENLNKLEAAHGTPYRKSLEEMLDAMYTGKSRRTSPSSLEGRSLNYLNNSVGTIMFLNQRSATLQMLSSFNYINWSDNNPLQAGKALANIPQFAKDFKTLFNSDWAKSRREGLRINVTESEIAEAVNGSKNVPKSITSFLLKKGFLPTQIADSMATALGGSTFYRNRTNTYVKEGMTQEKAEAKAMQDWVEISETNQQSSRPDKISSQQRSDLGKLLLAFANTPMQYTRETKKALLDIKNKRGDLKTNLSKVAYYTFVQNAIFSGMQSAVFKMAWSDDEQDQIFLEKKAPKIINSMGDSFLRGMGIGGALVSTLKNAGIKLYERSDRGSRGRLKDVAFDLLDVSPPVSSKVGKVYSALDAIDRAGGFEAATQAPVDLKNPLIKSGALMTEAFANVPANRALQKIQTITEAASSNREWYEKLALLSGWKDWEIDPEKVYKSKEEKFTERKAKRQEVFKNMSYEDYQTYKKWKKLKVNNGKDIVDFVELRKGK